MARFVRKLHLTPIKLAAVIVIILAIVAALWYFNRPVIKNTTTIPSASSDKRNQASNDKAAGGTTATPQPAAPKSTTGSSSASTVVLIAPWGNFVSNHSPGQGGSPTTETSVCNTTPGASCYIKFTNGDKTRTLDTKTTDANGSTAWSWNISDAGFSSGSWQITAIATLNGQAKLSTDQQSLLIP